MVRKYTCGLVVGLCVLYKEKVAHTQTAFSFFSPKSCVLKKKNNKDVGSVYIG